MVPISLILVVVTITIIFAPTYSFQQDQDEHVVINPCRLARSRRHPKSIPFIRIVDELTGQGPDVVLGSGGDGLLFYNLPPTTPIPIVIECSSGVGPVVWSYRGRGVSSGVKIVPTIWSRPSSSPGSSLNKKSLLRPSCYSAGLVISNLTDQLTGEYSCSLEGQKGDDANKNSFVLFVPQSAPFYYPEGDEVKVTLGSLQDPVLVLPCMSKRRSGAGIGLYREIQNQYNNETELERMELGTGLRFDPFVGFQLRPRKEHFDSRGTVNFTCKFEGNLRNFGKLENKILLRVLVNLRPEEKFAPDSSNLTAFLPYFSWTSLPQPVVELDQKKGSVSTVEWQQIYTKNDFEEGNASADIFHLGSFHLLDGEVGSEGRVTLRQRINGQIIKTWDYKVLDKEKEAFVGLTYGHDPDEGHHHVFTCVSATETKPNITFKALVSDELTVKQQSTIDDSSTKNYTVIQCPDHPDPSLGCLILTTTIPMGEVICIADGVDTTIRYPIGFVAPSRPFFLERGQILQITVDESDVVITLPCPTNTPEANDHVHLFWKKNGSTDTTHEWEMVWSPANKGDTIDNAGLELYQNWGFHIDTSWAKWRNPSGEYICSSSEDLEDRSDAVTVIVTKRGWSVSPKEEDILSSLPYSLTWAWSGDDEVVVKEAKFKDHVTVKIGGPVAMWTKAELRLTPELFTSQDLSTTINITLLRDGEQIHQWRFTRSAETTSQSLGLTLTTSWNKSQESDGPDTNSSIEIICRGSPTAATIERDRPRLNYYICQNKATCELIKKCSDKNCNSEQIQENELEADCSKDSGCLRHILKSLPLNGFLMAVCKYNGITETKTISDVFFREDVNWEFDSEDELMFLTSNAATTEQNPLREIGDLGSNLEWELGDSVIFSCGASPTSFSQGIRWAVEDGEGGLHFQPEDAYDPQWKYSSTTQVLSTFTLHITNFGVNRIWCFVPLQDKNSVTWKNLSQPVFIRGEIEENCHETEPSIRLISLYPPPSRLVKGNFSLSELRLDKLGSFVVPKELLQFGLRITAPHPVEWSFIRGSGGDRIGPSSTPLVQSDRAMSNFYDPSTYCYTSKLLINLRSKNYDTDTGSYVAKFGDKTLRFYLFVPNDKPPYLINSGNEMNVTLNGAIGEIWHLPCHVNNPHVGVKLFKQNAGEKGYVEVSNLQPEYDPSKGFHFILSETSESELLGNWKCVAGETSSNDFLLVNVLPQQKRVGELKYEQVGDIHVFTCSSENGTDPLMNITLDNSEQLNFKRKKCAGGCSIIMTTATKGTVNCLDDGVNATYFFGQEKSTSSSPSESSSQTKTGIWYDSVSKLFKCQLANSSTLPTSSLMSPDFVGVTCRRPNECRIMQQRLHDKGDNTQISVSHCGPGCSQLSIRERANPSWAPNWFSIFLRCNDMFVQYFQDNGVILSTTKESVSKLKKVRLDVVRFRKEGLSDLLQVKLRCFANRFFYSRGIMWGLERLDGTIDFQEHSAASEVEVQSFNSIMSEVLLDVDSFHQLRKVWCLPVLGSDKWTNASVSTPINFLVHNL